MLGEKKTTNSANQPVDDRNKEEVQALYTHLSSLSCVDDITGFVDKIHMSNDKYVEMASWVYKIDKIHQVNEDFLTEVT